MGNLRRKPDQILMNTIESDTLVLSGTGAARKLFIKDVGTIKLADLESVVKGKTNAGTVKSAVVMIKPLYPTSGKNGESGFRIERNHDFNGDVEDAQPHNRYYDGMVENLLAANAGYIAILDALEIAGQIQQAIRTDKAAIITSKLVLPITVAAVHNVTISIPVLNKSQNVTIASAGTITTLKTAIDAGALAGFITVDTAAGTLISNYGFTLAITSGITLSAYPQIAITAKKVLPTFNLGLSADCGSVVSITDVNRSPFTQKTVAQLFPIHQWMAGSQPNVALPNTDYNKYILKMHHDKAFALDGANHIDGFSQEIQLFVPTSVAEASNGALFDDKLYDFIVGAGFTVAESKLVHN